MQGAIFAENVAVITGASSGIGRALALQLAGRGAWLALAGTRADALESVAEKCRGAGGRALAVPTDVADPDQCAALIRRTVAEYGRLDTLVNNAGISQWARFEEIEDLAPFEQMLRVNYLGAVYCTYHALPLLRASRGRLAAVSSLAGRTGVPTRSGYVASKHAMTGFFDSLRIELSGSGVSVTVVYPGFVATEIRTRAAGADGKPLGTSPVREGEVMTAGECAARILSAVEGRRRELVMTPRGRIGLWLKLLAPGLVDRIARNAIEKGR